MNPVNYTNELSRECFNNTKASLLERLKTNMSEEIIRGYVQCTRLQNRLTDYQNNH